MRNQTQKFKNMKLSITFSIFGFVSFLNINHSLKGSFEKLKEIILRDFDMFSGKFLEKLFLSINLKKTNNLPTLALTGREAIKMIDIVAIDELEKNIDDL